MLNGQIVDQFRPALLAYSFPPQVRMQKLSSSMAVAAAALFFCRPVYGGEPTRIATAFEKDNPIDLHISLSYEFRHKRASILREWGQGSITRLAKDLIYRQQQHILAPVLELGLFHDLSVYLGLPIIVSDDREYAFDQRQGNDCIFPQDVNSTANNASHATCVDKTNSSSIRDGIIPINGFDALKKNAPYRQFSRDDTETIFRGPNRRGVDQLHVGIKFGLLNQKKYPLPHWIIALEGRFGVGKAMRFSREVADAPNSNHSVGRRIHELGIWTALSRSYRFFEPYFGAYWRYGLRGSQSEFQEFSTPSQREVNPQSHTGVYIGTEIIPWELSAEQLKLAFSLSGIADLHYGGRGYSEIWELLSDSPALVGTTNPGKTKCNVEAAIAHATTNPQDPSNYLEAANRASNSGDCRKFNGLTSLQDYGSFGLRASANFTIGPYASIQVGTNLRTDTRHFLSATSRGDPTQFGNSKTIDANSTDVSPLRRDIIDNAGRRFAIDNVLDISSFVSILLTF